MRELAEIIATVAYANHIRPEHIHSHLRWHEYAHPRQAVYTIARAEGHSISAIALHLNRDRQTIRKGIRAAKRREELSLLPQVP